jgi:hypothetical protein
MDQVKVYKGVEGLRIDISLVDIEDEDVPVGVLSGQKMFVMRPGASAEEEWEASPVPPNIIRHIVPPGSSLQPGKYKIQPYIETVDGYKGRGETVFDFEIFDHFR